MAILKYKNSNGEYVPLVDYAEYPTVVLQGTGTSEIDVMSQDAITKELSDKQDVLVSGINIATINGESLLGSGNIQIDTKIDPRETLRIILNSNQSGGVDDSLNGVTVTVTGTGLNEQKVWDGSSMVFYIDPGVTYTVSVSDLTGYKKPSDITYESEIQGYRTHTFTFLSELVNVTLSVDDSSDVSGQTITVTDTNGGIQIAQGNGSLSVKVPHDTEYVVSVNDKSGYTTPQNQTFMANQVSRDINLQYKKIQSAKIKISKTISDPASMITTEGDETLQVLLSRFRRCLGKSTEDNKINICYLRDDNSNYYHDGSNSILTGEEGDVFVYFPEFWYLGTDSSEEWIFNISLEYKEGYHHAPASLVGTYKGYVTSSKLYSRSGTSYYGNEVEMEYFSTRARNRGSGFHIIDYQQHCIIAWMFYARYKNTNSQAICGTGPDDIYNLVTDSGTTNSLGITDTTSSNASSDSNMLVNFLGIEGCWGHRFEYIEGIHSMYNEGIIAYDKGDFHDQPYSAVTSLTKRIVKTTDEVGYEESYITKIKGGSYMDMVGTDAVGSSNGSDSTYFCDDYMDDSETYEFYRGGFCDGTTGGVSFLYGVDYLPIKLRTSRLAFDGEITVIDDVNTFKAISNFR